MKQEIEVMIKEYVATYPELKQTKTRWKSPVFGTSQAKSRRFDSLKTSVRDSHITPVELLESAESVIAYFLPFEESVAQSNKEGYFASSQWAIAYIETNELIRDLNAYIIQFLTDNGYEATAIPATHNFDEETLMSDWSHRHVAEISGVGKFGLNNMLITEKGCSGRVGSIVTSLELLPSIVEDRENCLYLKNGSCGICISRCPNNAFDGGYDRFKCYELLLENDTYHEDLGLTDACGKCCTTLPCTHQNPCK